MFRRKPTVADAAEGPWQIFRGEHDGKALFARFNTGVRNASDKGRYPIQIGVTVPLRAPDGRGMPVGPEFDDLNDIEDRIDAHIAGTAVLVGTITTNGFREWVLYTATSEWIEAFHHALQAEVAGHEIQMMAQTDPHWNVYGRFVH